MKQRALDWDWLSHWRRHRLLWLGNVKMSLIDFTSASLCVAPLLFRWSFKSVNHYWHWQIETHTDIQGVWCKILLQITILCWPCHRVPWFIWMLCVDKCAEKIAVKSDKHSIKSWLVCWKLGTKGSLQISYISLLLALFSHLPSHLLPLYLFISCVSTKAAPCSTLITCSERSYCISFRGSRWMNIPALACLRMKR